MIQFSQIAFPRVPGVYVENDGSRASRGSAIQPHEGLIIAQKLSTGSAVVGTIYPIDSAEIGLALGGQHSQFAQMCAAWKAKDKLTPLYGVVPADDAGGGVNATGTITVAGTPTEARELAIYIAGRRLTIAVVTTDTATTIAAKIVTAVTNSTDMPVTAANVAGVVTLTARHKGTIGNSILIGRALRLGELVPAGITVVVVAMASGASDPDHAGAVTAMGDEQYHTLAIGIRTDTEIDKVVTELESRGDANRQIPGFAFVAVQDSRANLTTYGNGNNSKYLVNVGTEASALIASPWEIAAQAAAINARQCQIDPSINGVGTVFSNVYAAPRGSRFKNSDKEILLTDGISTTRATSDGLLAVEWLQTTYQTNSLGIADTAWRDLYKARTVEALRYSFIVWFSQFANFKLADDGNEIPGQNIMTPRLGRAEAISWFLAQKGKGWVENLDQFSEELLVQRNQTDENRMDFLLPPDVINNLVTVAARNMFR